MIVAILAVYLVLLFALVRFRIVRFNLFWKLSPFIVLLVLNLGLFIPMGWGAPQGSAIVLRNSVQIVSNVAGEVTDVPVQANSPLKAGDVLFVIDPAPYRATVEALQAQLKFSELRLAEYSQLLQRDSGRAFDVQQRQAEVDQLKAQLDGAQWNLGKTVIRAPADGYVTNLASRKGARVANLPFAPAMAFIDTSETIIGVEIPQINARYLKVGQSVEITFKIAPGRIFSGRVESILQAVASGQVQVSGLAVTPKELQSAPIVIRVKLDNADFARHLPAGSTGEAATFTDRVVLSHFIRKVLLRQIAITNYVNPF
jgi:RND family efflux transporter MFP subunit